MSTKTLMMANSIFLGLLGLSASFLPQEIGYALDLTSGNIAPLVIQLLGAGYLGFALMNWMAKSVLIGGIYAKPLALGNFSHFAIGGLAMLKGVGMIENSLLVWVLGTIYLLFAILFGMVLFTHPLKSPGKIK